MAKETHLVDPGSNKPTGLKLIIPNQEIYTQTFSYIIRRSCFDVRFDRNGQKLKKHLPLLG